MIKKSTKKQRKEIREIRNAVRRRPLHQVATAMALVPGVRHNYHPKTSDPKLNHYQQARYCLSQANLDAMRGNTHGAYNHLSWAHSLIISDARHSEAERVQYERMVKGKESEFHPEYDHKMVHRLKSAFKYILNKCETPDKFVKKHVLERARDLDRILEREVMRGGNE
jgi:hypothetical protein